MRKLLSVFLLSLFFVCVAQAQPQHIGLLVNGQFEGSGSGNGTIAGLEIQSVEHLRIKGEPLTLATNLTFTAEQKVYRNQFGGSVRATSLLRYAERRHRLFFAQAGVQVGGVAFPNTPGTSDGYAKYIWRPVVGGGVAVNKDTWATVVDYQFHFKRKLWANVPATNFGSRFVDGWSSGQRVGVAVTKSLNERLVFLSNAAAGWYTYQRNPAVYGAHLGSVVHRFNAYEASIGLGWKY